MRFAAMAGWQGGLLLAGIAALAVFLFLLKVRPRRVRVPSLLFWGQVLSDTRELTLWERIRRAVSLALTVLIALALGLALLRPARVIAGPTGTTAAGRVVIVLDSSWSMLARTRGGGTRWARAIADARSLASGASGGEIALATTADGLVEGPTSDLALIDAALDRLAPTGAGSAAWPTVGAADTVYFITDGAAARPREAGVTVRSVYERADNVGITAFEVRPALGGPAAAHAYLEVSNFAPAQQVHVTLNRGAAILLDRRFDMAAGETLRQVVSLDRGGDPAVRARVEASGNALAIDDDAFGWFERARPLAVTIVGEQTAWLARLLAGNPEVSATFVTPAGYSPKQEDAIVFDRWAPADPPARPALFFEPPARAPWLAAGGAVEQKPRWLPGGTHPVVRGVDFLTLAIERAQPYATPELLPVATSAHGTTLVSVSKSPQRPRQVVIGFGPQDSNLAMAPAFPVLVGNALAWLAGKGDGGGARRAGLAAFPDTVTALKGPDGAAIPLAHMRGEAVGILRAPGLYVVEEGGARATFPVNVGDPEVSNLARSSADATRALALGGDGASRPWWLYFAAAAFAAILIEWWTWMRRITV